MKIIVFGSLRDHDSGEYAASLSALMNLLARTPTLLIDFGDKPYLLRKTLEIRENAPGLDVLVQQFAAKHTLNASSLRKLIIHIPPADSWANCSDKSFDFLPGPSRITDKYLEYLFAQRGCKFICELMDLAKQLSEYKLLVFQLGEWATNTLRGEAIAQCANKIIYRITEVDYFRDSSEAISKLEVARGRALPPDVNRYWWLEDAQAFPFPHPEFFNALTSNNSEKYQHTIPHVAVEWVDGVFPDIRKSLRDPNMKPITIARRGYLSLMLRKQVN